MIVRLRIRKPSCGCIALICAVMVPVAWFVHWGILWSSALSAAENGDLPKLKLIFQIDPLLINAYSGSDPYEDACPCWSLLTTAIIQGHNDIVKFLVDEGADIEWLDKFNMTPLHNAAEYGNITALKLLLCKGANPNTKDICGYTPLHGSVDNGQPAILKLLVASGANPNAQNEKGDTPLHYAITEGKKEIVELLRELGASDKPSIYEAAAFGNLSAVEQFLATDPKLVNEPSKRKWPPLLYAVNNGQAKVAALLLENGAKRHPESLQLAVASGSVSTVEILIAYGARIRVKYRYSDETCLYDAASRGDAKMVKYLISKGVDVTAKSYDETPLEAAIREGHKEVMRILNEALEQRK